MANDHEDYETGAAPAAHKVSHQDGGTDEISVAGLAGETLTLAAHKILPAIHHVKFTAAEARAAINNIFGADGKSDAHINMDLHRIISLSNPVNNQDADTFAAREAGIAAHAGLATVHQDAPGLILTHKGDASAHHAKFTAAEARAAINNIFGADGKADSDINLDSHALLNSTNLLTSTNVLADHALIRGDGGARKVQSSTPKVTDNGEMYNPSQPAFGATLSAQQNNVTGDGTNYNLTGAIWTEVFDQNADFLNGTFTAPINGIYLFTLVLSLRGILATHTSILVWLITTTQSYLLQYLNLTAIAVGEHYRMSFSILGKMAATDTAYITLNINGGAKVVDLRHDYTYFSGSLIC